MLPYFPLLVTDDGCVNDTHDCNVLNVTVYDGECIDWLKLLKY